MHEVTAEIAAISGSILAVGGAIGLAWKKVVSPLAHVIVKVEETIPLIEDIRAEFQNNGGSTFKDAIDRIEHDGKNTRSALALHVREANRRDSRLDDLEQNLTDLTAFINTLIGLDTLHATGSNPIPQPSERPSRRRKVRGGE